MTLGRVRVEGLLAAPPLHWRVMVASNFIALQRCERQRHRWVRIEPVPEGQRCCVCVAVHRGQGKASWFGGYLRVPLQSWSNAADMDVSVGRRHEGVRIRIKRPRTSATLFHFIIYEADSRERLVAGEFFVVLVSEEILGRALDKGVSAAV